MGCSAKPVTGKGARATAINTTSAAAAAVFCQPPAKPGWASSAYAPSVLRSAARLSPSRSEWLAEAARSSVPPARGALFVLGTKNVNGHLFRGCA